MPVSSGFLTNSTIQVTIAGMNESAIAKYAIVSVSSTPASFEIKIASTVASGIAASAGRLLTMSTGALILLVAEEEAAQNHQ